MRCENCEAGKKTTRGYYCFHLGLKVNKSRYSFEQKYPAACTHVIAGYCRGCAHRNDKSQCTCPKNEVRIKLPGETCREFKPIAGTRNIDWVE